MQRLQAILKHSSHNGTLRFARGEVVLGDEGEGEESFVDAALSENDGLRRRSLYRPACGRSGGEDGCLLGVARKAELALAEAETAAAETESYEMELDMVLKELGV